MNSRLQNVPLLFLVLVVLLPFSSRISAAEAPRALDARVHHLGVAGQPEWSEFAGRTPEGTNYLLRFQAAANATESTLFLRQDNVKEEWRVELNGRRLGKLFQMEADLIEAFPVPPGVLHDGENKLEVIPPKNPDDIFVGEARLDTRPASEAVGGAGALVSVTESDTGRGLPCRITVVNGAGVLVPLRQTSGQHLALRPGVAYTPDGRAELLLAPGEYTFYATRGFEYGLAQVKARVDAGRGAEIRLSLRREVATPGLAACDTHVHTFTHSRHGDATLEERAVTLAGEGIELPVATDHEYLADYSDAARATQVTPFFTPITGCEVTTAKGHFNVFPVVLGSRVPDFRIQDWPRLMQSIRATPGVRVAILNHPRNIHSGFQPFASTNFNAVTGENLRGPEFTFDAVELINSSALQSDWMINFRDWFALLNHGYRVTGVGSSDVHDVSRYIVGQGRSYVLCEDSNPAAIDVAKACDSFLAGRILVSLGLLTDLTVESGGKQYRVGDLAPAKERFKAIVRVLAPSWIRADRIELFANGVKIREMEITAERGSLTPAEITQGVKARAEWTIDAPAHDVHLVAIASGPGVREPYWATARPYQPSSPEWKARVIGATNPVWIDADGDGQFSAARAVAAKILRERGSEPSNWLPALAHADAAVAAQAASLWQKSGGDFSSPAFQSALRQAAPATRDGVERFLRTQPRGPGR